jgi:excisionase family DNA binding protein
MEREYTIEELANLFEINPEAVHDYLVKNRIPFIKTGRDYLISDMDLGKKKRSIKRNRNSKSDGN